ncbi:MAG: ribbon-helix-helix protein, CopG family [Candidatus Diapherotrites archaeon]
MPQEKKDTTEISIKKHILERIDVLAKMSGKTRAKFLEEFFESYLDKYVEELALEKDAIRQYMAGKIDEKQLSLIVGKEKTEAAMLSKRIGAKGKEFLEAFK